MARDIPRIARGNDTFSIEITQNAASPVPTSTSRARCTAVATVTTAAIVALNARNLLLWKRATYPLLVAMAQQPTAARAAVGWVRLHPAMHVAAITPKISDWTRVGQRVNQ